MLLALAGIITFVWLVGLLAHIAGGFVNFLLVTAIVLVLAHIFGRRSHTV